MSRTLRMAFLLQSKCYKREIFVFRIFDGALNGIGLIQINNQTNFRQTLVRQGFCFIHKQTVRQKQDDVPLMHIFPNTP
ncbi:hypothetical protein [Burkholderia seminalis]|uniref:hypothetical protein n=1 Tax=Burkholderia seminalis TaxID=488731 RepID=UPI001ABBCC67|nr:hypothetical protein [Burkholderia seminalis]